MRRECLRFEDVIWNCAGDGADLPLDAQTHVEICPACARTLSEAKRISTALLKSDRIPAAPDCRAGVMARIAGSGAGRRWSYAWACAAVVIAVVAFGVVKSMPRPSTPPVVVRKLAPVVPKVEKRVVANSSEVRSNPVVKQAGLTPKKTAWKPIRVVVRKPKPVQRIATKPPGTTTTPPLADAAEAAIDSSRPVSVVVVSWEPTIGDRSYGYVQEDPDTGEITTCNVRRSGNNIELHMESTPGKSGPANGGGNHETNPGA